MDITHTNNNIYINFTYSTNFTKAVSLLGPLSSTANTDLALSLRIISNSDDVTDGIDSALDILGRNSSVEDADKILVRRVRR